MHNRSIRTWMLTILCLCLLLGSCLPADSPSSSPDFSSDTQPPQGDTATIPEGATAVAPELDLSSDLLTCSVRGDVLRIEQISPGLDTYGLKVTLYSLSKKQVLGSIDLGEDSWETGWTESGFYAISLDRKMAFLYNQSCQETHRILLPQDIPFLGLAMMNEKGNLFLLGDSQSAALLLYEPENGQRRSVAQMNGYTSSLAVIDGVFYIVIDEAVLQIRKDSEKGEVAYADRHASSKFPAMGIGKDETTFDIFTADKPGVTHIPYRSADEIVLSANSKGFLTTSSQGDTDLLRFYDIGKETVYTATIPPTCYWGTCIDEERFITVCQVDHTNRLYLYTLSTMKAKEISVSTDSLPNSDTTQTSTTQPSTATQGTKKLLDVPLLCQFPEFPTGCESVSTVMALKYAGESLTVTRFINEFLPQSSQFYFVDGKRFGPDPSETFIGSPKTKASYGCMAPVIQKALTTYFGTEDRVLNTTNQSLDELCRTYIDQEIPVLVWATISMIASYPTASWHLPDGTLFQWPANEHCLVLVGYDDTKYYFNDPYTGTCVCYQKDLCNNRHAELGRQSLVITKR